MLSDGRWRARLSSEKPEARVACAPELPGACCMGLPAAVVCAMPVQATSGCKRRCRWCCGDVRKEKGWD